MAKIGGYTNATRKQRKLAQAFIESAHQGARKTNKELALQAGYSHASAKSISNIMQRKSFKELVEDMLPDSYLLERHETILQSNNDAVRLGGLKLAYQIKGHLAPESNAPTVVNVAFLNEPGAALPTKEVNSREVVDLDTDKSYSSIDFEGVVR